MSETRYHDFGRFVQAGHQNELQTAFFETGVLHGCDLSVSASGSEIEVATGSVITSGGVVIYNDTTRTITFTPQVSATIFTVTLYHVYSEQGGGSQSILAIEEITSGGSAIFATSTTNKVILGWIRYPGGSVDPQAYMLHEAPKMRLLNSLVTGRIDEHIPIYVPLDYRATIVNSSGLLLVPQDSDVSSAHSLDANGFIRTVYTNAHAGVAKTLDVYCRPNLETLYRPREIVLDLDTNHVNTSIAVYFNNNGTSTLLNTLTGALLSGVTEVLIPDNVITTNPIESGAEWGIYLACSIQPTMSITFRRVYVIASPLPRDV